MLSAEEIVSRVEGSAIDAPSKLKNTIENLSMLNEISNKSLNNPCVKDFPVMARDFHDDIVKANKFYIHSKSNIRLNIRVSKIQMTESKTMSTQLLHQTICKEQNSNFMKTIEPKVDSTVSLLVHPKTAGLLSPALNHIIEILNKDKATSYLGSLSKHVERAARNSSFKPVLDIDEMTKELNSMNLHEFKLKYASSSAGASLIQAYLTNCSNAEAVAVGELIKDDYEVLTTHKYGHSIIKNVIGVHEELTNRATKFCTRKFAILVSNECASRILQRLVEESSDFRLFCLKRLSKNVSLWMKSVAGLFVLTACMRCSEEHEYRFVTDILLKDINKLVLSKLMKRALVSVIEACTPSTLDIIYGLLNVRSDLIVFLEDKYMTYVLISFLRRDYVPAVNTLTQFITSNLKELISKSYFKLLANKIISVGSNFVLDAINISLLNITSMALFNLCDGGRSLQRVLYYVFLTISSFRLESFDGERRLLDFVRQLCLSPVIIKMDVQLVNLLRQCLQPSK